MSKASLLELCHDEKKYETFSISENNESLLSDSWRKRIERFYFKNQTKAMCVHKTPCRSLFISFVSFSFNSPHVSIPTRTSIRASEIRVLKNIRVIRIITSLRSVGLRRILCSKSRVPHVSAPPRTKIRESEIRMPNKNIRVIRVIRVQKIQYEIRVPHKNIRVIPKAPQDFFRGFFDIIVVGRTDYALMTEALLVKPV